MSGPVGSCRSATSTLSSVTCRTTYVTPTTTITSPTASSWQTTNFSVSISDNDNGLSPIYCYYSVVNNGSLVVN